MDTFCPVYQPGNFALYIHVPFCLQKCGYCSFYSIAGGRTWFKDFINAVQTLVADTARLPWAQQRKACTLFFGGGTPSILPVDSLIFLIQLCVQEFNFKDSDPEISVEVNPATLDYAGLCSLRRAGVNRLSIGVQSLEDTELLSISRAHTAAEAQNIARLARQAGFTNLSLDLIYGLPGQTPASWARTLDKALFLKPDHLSVYELTIEAGTPFAIRRNSGQLVLPEEDDVWAMMEYTALVLPGAGLRRYEISNYARAGYECNHNINYWLNGSYLGFGPGAVSCCSGNRTSMIADVARFCQLAKTGQSVIGEQEKLSTQQRFRETVIMGLRMLCGISVASLQDRFEYSPAPYYGATLDRLTEQGMITLKRGRLKLTPKGLLLANSVMSELV